MSEFMNKTKISALERSNSELTAERSQLTTEISKLKTEIAKLKAEIDRLNGKDLNIIDLELKDIILEDKHPAEPNQVKETVAEYKQKQIKTCTIAFLLGILATLSVWAVTAYLNNGPRFLSFLK